MKKSKRNKHKSNVVLKGNQKDIKIDIISIKGTLNIYLLVLGIRNCVYYTIAL